MRLLILFLLVVSTLSKPLFDRACRADPANCVAADFAFTKEYLGRGVCGGYALQTRKDPAGNPVDTLDECGFWDTCQFNEKLDFDCDNVLFQTNKQACYEYIGTGTCQYSELKGVILGLVIATIVLLVGLLLQWRSYASDMAILKQLERKNKDLDLVNTITLARGINNNKAGYAPIPVAESGRQTRF